MATIVPFKLLRLTLLVHEAFFKMPRIILMDEECSALSCSKLIRAFFSVRICVLVCICVVFLNPCSFILTLLKACMSGLNCNPNQQLFFWLKTMHGYFINIIQFLVWNGPCVLRSIKTVK